MYIAAGLSLFDFPFSDARAFWKWIDMCESGGVDSIWQSDRIVRPANSPMLECMSTMAALAGATKRIKFGMNVASVGLREPVLLAHQCATIDMLSEGRLLPAFGIGSPQSLDWQGLGVPTKGRGQRADEALDIMAALWRGETVTFDGKYHQCKNASIAPLPVQKKLPIWIGGSSAPAIRRTARIGSGWLGGRETPSEVDRVIRRIKKETAIVGRSIDEDHYGVGMYFRLGAHDDPIVDDEIKSLHVRFPDRDPSHAVVTGRPEDFMARLAQYYDAGASKFIFRPVARGDEDLMDQTRKFIETVLPEIDALNQLRREGKAKPDT